MQNTILIVGSDKSRTEHISDVISKFDCNILITKGLEDSVNISNKHELVLVIIDMSIHDVDILKFAHKIKGTSNNFLTPIVFITNKLVDDNDLLSGIQSGTIDYLMDPIVPALLIGKVNIYFQQFNQRKILENEIEQRKQTEDKYRLVQANLKKAKFKAEEADKLKSAFLANMSHEIRTPMNAIIGFSNLLASENLNDKQRNLYAKYINNSSNSLLGLIDDIIDIAKIEAGQLKITTTNIYIQPVLRELYRVYNDELVKKGKSHINLRLSLPEDDNSILSDDLRLRQIISNLINNAIKFTTDGEIEFGYQIKNNQQLVFFVRDTGIGIPADKLEAVFNRFERIENHCLPDASGTGLGLSIAKKIVELLGGKVWVESTENKGSTFYISLPYDEKLDGKRSTRVISDAVEKEFYTWNNKLVLIAEDEFINFQFLKESLRQSGIKILWAKNGQEAVELVRKNPDIDMVLMDIKMPLLTGYEATAIIKAEKPFLPVIAQTAYAMAGEKDNCIEAGFDEYISKPIKPKALFEIMQKLIKQKKVLV